MLGDAVFDMLAWHNDLAEENMVPIAPYNERNADDPYDIDHRTEQRIKEHSETVRVRSKQLKETYEQRSQVERTIGACKDCSLETPSVRDRVRVKYLTFFSHSAYDS
jgi:RNA polymerase-binding transcription factor DksA